MANRVIYFATILSMAGGACDRRASVERNHEAEARMAALLDASVITYLDSTHVTPDSLFSCAIESASDPHKALAWSRVLGSDTRSDTVEVAAEIITVGRLSQRVEGGYVMGVRVESDTLHWPMVRDSITGRWGACGFPREGYVFMRMIAGPDTRWDPPGASWAAIAAASDSVRAARSR